MGTPEYCLENEQEEEGHHQAELAHGLGLLLVLGQLQQPHLLPDSLQLVPKLDSLQLQLSLSLNISILILTINIFD